jgi:hypothetical protein
MKCKKCKKDMILGKADVQDMDEDELFNEIVGELDCHICKECNYVFVEL